MAFILKTPQEIMRDLAAKAKQCRLDMNLSQEGLSAHAGVSLGSLKRFERTGQISLISLLKLALVLDELNAFNDLFTGLNKKRLTLKDILKHNSERKRGRNK